jgi:hypothetical protein
MLKKLSSRKFIAWLTWTVVVVILIARGEFTDTACLWYGVVTGAYIGGNVAMDHIYAKGTAK